MKNDHCAICPKSINREKRIAILRHALAVIKTQEAIQALEQDNILAELAEPALCEACEVSP